MENSTFATADISDLRSDLAALQRDVSDLMSHLKTTAANGASSAVSEVGKSAQHLYQDTVASGSASIKAISKGIEDQPILALLIAAGVGYLGARLLSR